MASTARQVIQRLSNRLKASRPDINVEPASVTFDLFIDLLADEKVRSELIADYNGLTASIDGILDAESNTDLIILVAYAKTTSTAAITSELSARLEGLVSNNDITRNPAIYASGIVKFTRSSPLGSGDRYTIPQGARVTTDAGAIYLVSSNVEATLAIGNVVPFGSLYAVDVPVTAAQPGVAGNMAAQKITTMVSTVPGFTGVTNTDDISGGAEQETDASLGARAKLAYQANNVGTTKGYEKFILDLGFITDTLVIGATDPSTGLPDPLMQRTNGFGGAVDIYILEEALKTTLETFTGMPPSGIVALSKQPVRSIITTGWDLKKDIGGLAASYIAHDRALLNTTSPAVPFSISYIYNSMPERVQALVQEIDVNLRDDVLVKEATKVLVDMSFRVRTKPGYDFGLFQSDLNVAITNFVDTLKIGTDIEASDVVGIITNTAGYDQVMLPFDEFNRQDQLSLAVPIPYVNTIVIDRTEFARLGNLIITQI